MTTTVNVRFRNYATETSPAITGPQISSMCGQTARLLSRPGDHMAPLGKVTVISTAPLDDDFVRLGVEVSSPYGGDILPDDTLVGIGYVRESDERVRLMDMAPEPGPPVVPASPITDEERRRERIGMGPSGSLGEALLAGQTVHADPERGFADGGVVRGLGSLIVDPPPAADASSVSASARITSATIRTGSLGPIVEKYGTEAECERHGGHCFVRTGLSNATAPPQHHEACKHCPATRLAIPREPYRYRYPNGREEG